MSYYWKNILKTTGVTQPYGITVNNDASDVTIVGCDVTGDATNGIVVANAADLFPTNIFIRACDASGYSSYGAAININGAESSVEVTNCAGYNDQNAALNGGTAPTSATSASTSSTPYFGPSTVTFSNASTLLTVHIGGVAYTMTSGSVYLANPLDQIYFSATPSKFAWLGK